MRVFVTGVGGQLGYDMMRELLRRGHEGVGSDLAPDCGGGFDYVRLDITDQGAVERAICETRPDAVVHCAGWTAVDAAEDPENRGLVHKINVDGTRYLADSCKKVGCKMWALPTLVTLLCSAFMPQRCSTPLKAVQ